MKKPHPMYVVVAYLAVLTAGIGLLIYLRFFESNPLSYRDQPFLPIAASVRAGEVIPLKITRCNNSDESIFYRIQRTLENVDNRTPYMLPTDQVRELQPGCHTSISLANVVPREVPSGRYRILGISEVHGGSRNHYVTWSSGPFEVVAPDAGRPCATR